MLHQPILLHAQEMLNLKKRLNEIYAKHTGCGVHKIEDALERDTFLTAEGAVELGVVDKVVAQREQQHEIGTLVTESTA